MTEPDEQAPDQPDEPEVAEEQAAADIEAPEQQPAEDPPAGAAPDPPPAGSAEPSGTGAATAGADDGRRSDEYARRIDGLNRRRMGERRAMGKSDDDGVLVEGIAASGRIGQAAQTINNFGPRNVDRIRSVPFTEKYVQALVDTYVHVGEYNEILDTLQAHGFAYLMGPNGSGRTATAIAALREFCAADQMRYVSLAAADPRLDTLLDDSSALEPKHGHVLELTSAASVRPTMMGAIAGVLPRDTYLVVIGPPAATVDERLRPCAVGHGVPQPEQVLRRHLCALICPPQPHVCSPDVDLCLADTKIREHLEQPRLPGELAELARRIAAALDDGRPASSAVPLLYVKLREIAVNMVSETTGRGFLRAHLRKMALRVAYVVYFDLPLTDVFAAAAILFRCLTAMTNSTSAEVEWEEATLFDGGVGHLLDESMCGAPDPQAQTGHESRARVVDSALSRAVLDVLWNEYDQVRTPLLIWIRQLGEDPRDRVRLRAASAAGVLAGFNFSEVYREVFRPWADSARYACRDAAAWSLEFVAADRSMTARVRRQVQDWCLSSNAALNDTAARCYSTVLGRRFAEEALDNLRYLAHKPEQTRYTSIPLAVTEICWPENGAVVLRALAAWLSDTERSPNAQAARTLLFLAHEQDTPPDAAGEVWPALLVIAREDPELAAALRRLWHHALSEPITARRAWDVLADWIVRAARDRPEDGGPSPLEPIVVDLAVDLLREGALRRRALRFYFREWKREHGALPIFTRIENMITGRGRTS